MMQQKDVSRRYTEIELSESPKLLMFRHEGFAYILRSVEMELKKLDWISCY